MQICLIALQDFFLAGKSFRDFFFDVMLGHAFFLAVTTPPSPSKKFNGSPLEFRFPYDRVKKRLTSWSKVKESSENGMDW